MDFTDPAPRLLDLAERGRHPDVLKRVGDRAKDAADLL